MLAFGVLFVAGCASGESYTQTGYDFSTVDKVAVVEITGDVAGEVAKNQVADFFAMEAMKKGYVVVEREQVQAVLEEQEFQASDLTTNTAAARAGEILNVPAVIMGNVSVEGNRISMTAKMVDTETAGIAWMGTGYGSTGRTLSTVGGAVVGAAAGAAVGGDGTGKVVGGVAGGVLGGVAGNALAPQMARQVQKVVEDVCEKMPAPY